MTTTNRWTAILGAVVGLKMSTNATCQLDVNDLNHLVTYTIID